MSLLSRIERGRQPVPPRIVLYGTEGIGKSTFASQTPVPIFVPTEDGLSEIDCERFPLAKSLDDVLTALAELHAEQHEYQTVALDSLDWLERLIFDDLCRQYNVTSIEKVDGGYAHGYTLALTHWRKVLDALNRLRNDRGMAVICIAHAKAGKEKADIGQLHVRGGEFVANEVEDLMDQDRLVQAACAEIVGLAHDRHACLIFASGVKHGQHVTKVLQEMSGRECGFVCGETPTKERDELLGRFRTGDLRYLANVNVLTTGFDAPNIDCVALLRPPRNARSAIR